MVRKDLNGLRFAYDPDKTAYFIDRGLRRPLTGKANDTLFGNASWNADTVQLGSVTVGDLLTDNVYLAITSQGPNKDTVFLIDDVRGGLQKRPITARGYQTCGFKPARTVQQAVLDPITTGDLIDWIDPYLNGSRFAYDPDKTAYFIDRGLRRPLTGKKANDSLFGNALWKAAR